MGTVFIKDIKEILEAENIKLGNRPHVGYYLVGRESDIRNFMVKLFLSDTGFSTVDGSLVEGCRDFTGFIRELERFLTSFGLELNDHRTVSIMKYFIILPLSPIAKHS